MIAWSSSRFFIFMSGKISKCSHLFHRTQTSPKTGTRACSNRYTGYQVRFSVHLLPMCVCVCVFVRVCLSLCVFVCVCFLLTIVCSSKALCVARQLLVFICVHHRPPLRDPRGKPVPPHLHVPRELWQAGGEIERYPMAMTALLP